MFHRKHLPVVESTNDWLKKKLEEGTIENNLLIFTQNQTKGRGQFDRQWHMEPDLDLAFSFFIEVPKVGENFLPAIHSMTVCLALHNTFDRLGIPALIKWPNDLLAHGKKISGILLESILSGKKIYLINGIGINLNSARKDKQSNYPSISVKDIICRDVLAEDFIDVFEESFKFFYSIYNRDDHATILSAYEKNMYKLGEVIALKELKNNQILLSKIKCVDAQGRLIVEHEESLKSFHSGEVKWLM
ncbi:biotin--[acetyl-CoA-carboxylase] ligase [Thermaurantimonas aggregans]|uniref:Biotin--[acetyl-CoA-carboxylase] ligase n=2 Tax=Thermaurantimonas aggregans TaxID=2173829 RepID=A0A401XJE7_9FLAO|nr:biotin--[acetyl-CoA-carboxylase] ligase [Thermaurantimonas aggregans]